MRQKVIIMGHGYTSRLGVIRALGLAGYYVIVIAITADKRLLSGYGRKPIDCHSKYVKEYYYCLNKSEYLVNFLLENFVEKEKAVLFPDSDFTTSVIDSNLNRLLPYFYLPNIKMKQGEIVKWMDKQTQKDRAEKLGINVTNGIVIEIRNKKYSIPKSIKFPCFTKPLVTITGGKNGLKKCNSRKDLESVLNTLALLEENIKVLVEDYLVIDKEYAVVGFSDGKNVIIPGVIYITQMATSGHFGVARCGELLPTDEFIAIINKFKEYVRSINFVGLFDIDFLYCQGKYYFDEMNMRFGGSGTVITSQGINLPQMLVDFLLKGKYNNHNYKFTQTSFVNERMCVDDWYCGNISSKELEILLNSSSISFIRNETDPAPYKSFMDELRILKVKRFAKKIIRKLHLYAK